MRASYRIMVLLLSSTSLLQASPFSMNGWQFHDWDVPKLAEAIKRAPDYGVNLFIFSHGLFDHVEFFNSPERQRDVLYLGSLADQEKIAWYLWVHELDDIPERFRIREQLDSNDPRLSQAATTSGFHLGNRVNLDDPRLLDFLGDRYERLLQKCPTAAGLVLTLHESDNKVFRNSEVQSKLAAPERIYLIAKLVYDVVKQHNKKLILRNFFYEPKEMEYFAQAIARLPNDIIIMNKDSVHEFDPWYPPDPMRGKVGKKQQIMEPDLGVEKAWGRQGHYAQVAYIKRYLERARDTHMIGAVGRARLLWDHPFNDSHEINLYAFSRFMQDPDLGVDTVFDDWAALHYPKEAVPYVVSALKRTEFIQHHGRWFLGFWLTKSLGDEWGDYPYYFEHIRLRSRYKWTHDPADKTLEEGLYSPDNVLFARLVDEKEQVIQEARASIDDVQKAARYLSPEQLASLQGGFNYLLDAAELQREWTRAFFAERMWMKEPNEENAMIIRDAIAKLQELDALPGVRYGRDSRTGHRYNIDKFVLEMHWRMANRRRALEEDARILEQTKQLMAVESN